MDDINVNGIKYRWLYEERDGSNWYVPKTGWKPWDKTAVNI